MKEKLNGLDLFSGIGGNTLGLREWVRAVAYCERDKYAQGVLLSRMSDGSIEPAPIWDDVTTLKGSMLPRIDIIIGGFPCQDISVAGRGAGLEGERSGLFFEIVRLAQEIKPAFLFLENVPAIRTRGLDTVVRTLSSIGYDCRWDMLSASDVGASHKRERWFLLAAHTERLQLRDEQGRSGWTSGEGASELGDDGTTQSVAHTTGFGRSEGRAGTEIRSGRNDASGSGENVADACGPGLERIGAGAGCAGEEKPVSSGFSAPGGGVATWEPEPNVDRVVNGLPHRVDRIRCLGNAVVPAQAREAFKRLVGIGG